MLGRGNRLAIGSGTGLGFGPIPSQGLADLAGLTGHAATYLKFFGLD